MDERTKAVLDSGPFIHLKEINDLKALKVFGLRAPIEVSEETKGLRGIKCGIQAVKNKTMIGLLNAQFGLGFGEAAAIALCKELGIELLLTDDLDARTVAKKFGLLPHGSVGILLRAFKKKIFSKKETMGLIRNLKTDSSLYITNDLIEYVMQEVQKSK